MNWSDLPITLVGKGEMYLIQEGSVFEISVSGLIDLILTAVLID